ncbi:porin [Oceanomicrobium pacificus]|uniref:Porin n=1 Tax=Oceanomicrobium pacificus TaxID=2692916 RepID=A0A6B0TV18_9RHOB|nr:hypothetical protein [Oceanomicrobium pacificus]MXU64974.1 hypothetical protein [Oceanomicrobium pacificus]
MTGLLLVCALALLPDRVRAQADGGDGDGTDLPTAGVWDKIPRPRIIGFTEDSFFPVIRYENGDRFIEFYGQINKGFLTYNDGVQSDQYNFVDSDVSGTRGGLTFQAPLTDGWTSGGRLEYGLAPSNAGDLTQPRDGNVDRVDPKLRHADVWVRNPDLGRFWAGQGAMASDGVSGIDLSGTGVVASAQVNDRTGGLFFRRSDDSLSLVAVGDVFTDMDGLGRRTRLRYDSPRINGFDFRTSIGQDVLNGDDTTVYDAAVTYRKVTEPLIYYAAVAASKPGDDWFRLNGSASFLHTPSGTSLTMAAGNDRYRDRSGRFLYLKLGYEQELFSFGSTALSVDGYFGNDITVEDSKSRSYALSAVQNIDYYNTELYVSLRSYDFRGPPGSAGYQTGTAFLTGFRVRF